MLRTVAYGSLEYVGNLSMKGRCNCITNVSIESLGKAGLPPMSEGSVTISPIRVGLLYHRYVVFGDEVFPLPSVTFQPQYDVEYLTRLTPT